MTIVIDQLYLSSVPFKSDKQRKFMYANHPEIARRWSDKEEAARHNSLQSVYGLDEATGGDVSIFDRTKNPPPEAKLGIFPWKNASHIYGWIREGGGSAMMKDLGSDYMCFAGLMPSDTHASATTRGTTGRVDWIVDVEVVTLGQDGMTQDFVYHIEKRADNQKDALRLRKQIMDFVDAKTMRELLAIPRSGKLSMSRFP